MITLQVSPPGPISMDEGQAQIFVATLGLDTNNKGVTWTLTGSGCAGTGCGMISSTTAAQITYTSPTGLTAAQTVSLEAVSKGNSGATKTVSITINQAPQFTTLTLPNGSNGVGYSQQVAAEFGVTPYLFSIVCPPPQTTCLPPGLSINPNTGAIVGTPTTNGTFNFSVGLKDNAFMPLSVTSDLFTVTINKATPLVINSGVLPTPLWARRTPQRCKLRAGCHPTRGACQPIPCLRGSPSTRPTDKFSARPPKPEFSISSPR